ncbi:MAG: helix-turn-helix transcriptional regulator [Symbiopectobacterium sp.]|uniref:helix-turn-helix transcriptional regulator n=1 Tax=Symbiopectobacterium sp. TaxID=2952789 RepID=UPI0039E85682
MKFTFGFNASDVLCSFLEQKLEIINNAIFAYSIINKGNISEIFIASNYHDDWVKMYLDNKLQYVDPVVVMALRRCSPFVWNEDMSIFSNIKFTEVFALSRTFDIVNGYTFVLHDYDNNLVTLSLLIDKDAKNETEAEIKKNKSQLQLLLIEIHEKTVMFFDDNNKAPSLNDALFTARETEVLYWCSLGKTYSEISIILGISPRTVKFHMARVKSKLGVVNAKQAIRLSSELGLIKSPRSLG